MCLNSCRWYYYRFLLNKLLLITTTASTSAKYVRVMELFVHCLNPLFRSPVFGESDEIYITTVLGLDRGNTFDGTTVLILGGGDGGLLHTLTSLPKPPRHVLMAEVSFACRAHALNKCFGPKIAGCFTDPEKYEPVWPSGKALGFGSPFSSKVVVCGHYFVTLSLTIMKHWSGSRHCLS